ncbi:cobyrinate a,c-diamide synthase [Clostridium sp.]|uniref:cobyrinate a,c-diamide synthase n=1 Tax=Clostridium sp. TaxID=1506 RepID=UPI003D6D74DD
MKTIVISSNSSGGGKTTITLGLMKALINKGYSVQGYKVGPDYIDTAFHSHVTAKPSRNLDLFLMGEEGVKASFTRGIKDSSEKSLGVIEGVMGIYDGKGITTEYSTAHLAKTLNLPIVLIISPKAQCATLCAEINGIMNFEDANIVGVILNNISESYFKLLKCSIEKYCNIVVFGYVPKDERLSLKSRHLGLVQSSEIKDLDYKVTLCSQLMEESVDLDQLIKCFKDNNGYEDKFHVHNKGMKIAVAIDNAFSFYYRENLELLGELGEIIYFSPLVDSKLPEDIDFLYIGGGYPEVFAKELSLNRSMLLSIKTALLNGLSCYCECGGLMYLSEAIDGIPTVGFFSGESHMTKKLQNFGYAKLNVQNGEKNMEINCHEFHKSYVELDEKKEFKLTKTMYNDAIKEWQCGYIKNNTKAVYAHIHFFGCMEFFENFLFKNK